MKPDQFCKLVDGLKARKSNLEAQFEDIQKFATPNDPTVQRRQNTPGQTHHVGRYDSTAIKNVTLLAATLHGSMTPSTSKWFDLAVDDPELNERQDVREWIDEVVDRIHAELNASNFKTQIFRSYTNLIGYGTNSIIELTEYDELGDYKGITFQTFAIREYTFIVDADGNLVAFFREFSLTAEQARDKFKKLPGFNRLGEKIEKVLEFGKPEDKNRKFKFLHAVYPHEYFGETAVDFRDNKFRMKKPIASRYINVEEKIDVSFGGFDEMPVSVSRWDLAEDDDGWGRSPAWVAMPEIKTLNRHKELTLKAFAKDVSPPLIVPHKGVVGGLKTGPNQINYYNALKTGGQKPEYLTSGARWDVHQLGQAELIKQINEIFLVDKLQLPERPDMTATEVQVRFDLLQRLLGPTFQRITDELLDPIIVRTFHILLRAGRLPPVPDSLDNVDGFDIVYIGPLAKAQRLDEVNAIRQIVQDAGAVAQLTQDPAILDNIDFDAAIDVIADQTGVPARVMRAIEDVEAIREQRQAAVQGQQALDQVQQAVEIEGAAANVEAASA